MPSDIRSHRYRRVVAGLLIIAAGPALADEKKELDRTFTATPGGLLTVIADGADISVTGTDSPQPNANQVAVHMVAKGSRNELEALNLSATQTADGVTVEMRRPENGGLFSHGSWQLSGTIEVTVPRNYRVDAKTSGGDVRIDGTSGTARVRSSGGDISARNVKGDLNGQTSGGDLNLDDVEGAMNIKTSGGDIRATRVHGDIDASTSGGDVRLTGVDGRILASTSGGDVFCELVGTNRGISTSTSGGDIEIRMPRNTQGTLDAESNGGDISSDFSVASVRSGEHKLKGELNGGGDSIRVRTSGGEIKLTASN